MTILTSFMSWGTGFILHWMNLSCDLCEAKKLVTATRMPAAAATKGVLLMLSSKEDFSTNIS